MLPNSIIMTIRVATPTNINLKQIPNYNINHRLSVEPNIENLQLNKYYTTFKDLMNLARLIL